VKSCWRRLRKIQDINYRGGRGNNNCDFDLKFFNENHQKDRLSFSHNNGTAENPVGNLTTVENQAACTTQDTKMRLNAISESNLSLMD